MRRFPLGTYKHCCRRVSLLRQQSYSPKQKLVVHENPRALEQCVIRLTCWSKTVELVDVNKLKIRYPAGKVVHAVLHLLQVAKVARNASEPDADKRNRVPERELVSQERNISWPTLTWKPFAAPFVRRASRPRRDQPERCPLGSASVQ